MLKPQDIFILLKLIALGSQKWNFATLAKSLFMSSSEVHAGYKRAEKSQLINHITKKPNLITLEEFLIHGIRYTFPAKRGELTRGLPTASAVEPLKGLLVTNEESIPVWPYAKGNVRGFAFEPLYKSVPQAVELDHKLYNLLALVDAIRGGRTRERAIATKELQSQFAEGKT